MKSQYRSEIATKRISKTGKKRREQQYVLVFEHEAALDSVHVGVGGGINHSSPKIVRFDWLRRRRIAMEEQCEL